MIAVDLRRIGATYYTGNCHKWLCAPRAAGFLHVRRDRQERIVPPVISHGYNRPRAGYSRFQDLFDWPGTLDPTPWICVGAAIEFLEVLLPGGMSALLRRNHEYAVAAQSLLVNELIARPLCPPEMLGSMAAVELASDPNPPTEAIDQHRLNRELFEHFQIEVPVYFFPASPRVVLRVSAQAYNEPGHYRRLVESVQELWDLNSPVMAETIGLHPVVLQVHYDLNKTFHDCFRVHAIAGDSITIGQREHGQAFGGVFISNRDFQRLGTVGVSICSD